MTTPRTASDIMTTEVMSVDESETMQSVADILEIFRFRHMPVTDDGALVGLMSQRDLLRAGASSADPHAASQGAFLGELLRVKDIMATDVATVRPETPLTEVAELMRSRRLGCVPVVTGHNTLVGLITEADFVILAERLLRAD